MRDRDRDEIARRLDDASSGAGEDHQHEQQPARCRRHLKEIRRHDLSDVIRQERAARL
jgi:hypothetical protein